MAKGKGPEILSISGSELEELLATLQGCLSVEVFEKVRGLLQTLQWVLATIEQKTISLARLGRLLFGPKTEKTSRLFPKPSGADSAPNPAQENHKRKGHGRRKAGDYPGAKLVPVPHPQLRAGATCPECRKGKLRLLAPACLILIKAQPMISAIKYELEKLRCTLCGKVFTAPVPPEAVQGKYDSNVGVVLAINRYGMGVPMYRTEKWQNHFGVPMAASTQWEQIAKASQAPKAVYEALQIEAAQAELIHSDDTNMRIQELARQRAQADAVDAPDTDKRTGCFTTGIVAKVTGHQVALFMTGAKHAGENLDEVLQHRAAHLDKLLHMADGLSRNESKEFETIVCNCMSHARRAFVDVVENFPEECRYVLESLRQVYRVDAQAKEQRLCDLERLALHQEHSQPIMEALKDWMEAQMAHQKVEPNSGLGQAIKYMLKRWERLTRFLTVLGAPLDNNLCERTLKTAVLHRKNSMSFKTFHGAQVGDAFMSLIHTCALNGINPFDYLMALNDHVELVVKAPAQWFPWSYQRTLAALPPSNST